MAVHELFLCLGGNLGNKTENFKKTLDLIQGKIGRLKKASALFSSPAWGFESENEFWNQVVQIETFISPQSVLDEIRQIENLFGRKREPGKIFPRKIDIDILFYDDQVIDSKELTIPHPFLAQRNFVLVPLVEIAPELIHPVLKQSANEMLENCTDKSIVTLVSKPGTNQIS
jgi:2-amino-4-hydroxy-6-hydroxymethyldihydropteridine diphosphokinase